MKGIKYFQRVLCGVLLMSLLLPWTVRANAEGAEESRRVQDMVTITTIRQAKSFAEEVTQVPFVYSEAKPASNYVLVFPESVDQTMLGLGGAMTESAAYNISKLSASQQAMIYEAYYGESGARYALTRSSIGSADFSLRSYSYDDSAKADPQLTQFSIEKDYDYIIPAIKMIQRYNPNVKFFAAPWAPPAWMKKSGRRQGGMSTGGLNLVNNAMDSKYYESYANYLVKYCQEYAKAGIPVYCLSMQNESQNNPQWECCTWTTSAAKTLIGNYLGPALEKNGINTKLVIWDWDKGNDTMHKDGMIKYCTNVLADAKVRKYVDGVAFHWYAGDLWHEISGKPMWSEDFYSLDEVKAQYPGIHLYATEACQEKGTWFGSYEPAYRYIHDILNDFEHGAECFIDWNLVLDSKGGPTQGVDNPCHAPIMLDSGNKVVLQPSYYVMKMISRAVQPGTVHIKTTSDVNIDKTAVIDGKGNVSVLLGNTTKTARTVTLKDGSRSVTVNVPAYSLTTVSYGPEKTCDHGETEVREAAPATCGTDGYTGDTYCLLCDELVEEGTVIPATGDHTWDNGEVTKEPTQTETGIMTYTCTVCGGTTTEELPVLPPDSYAFTELEAMTNAKAAALLARGEYYVFDGKDFVPAAVTVSRGSKVSFVCEDGKIYDEADISDQWTAKNGRTFTAKSPYVTSSLVTYTRTHKSSYPNNWFWYVNDSNPKDTTRMGSTDKAARSYFKNADEFRSDGATGKDATADDPFYVAAVYNAVTRKLVTTVNIYTYNGGLSSVGDQAQCPVTLYARNEVTSLEEEEEPAAVLPEQVTSEPEEEIAVVNEEKLDGFTFCQALLPDGTTLDVYTLTDADALNRMLEAIRSSTTGNPVLVKLEAAAQEDFLEAIGEEAFIVQAADWVDAEGGLLFLLNSWESTAWVDVKSIDSQAAEMIFG